MAKYLWRASYTAAGVEGLLKEGGSSRRHAVEQLVEQLVAGLGGKVESWHYAFGSDDVYVIAELPSDVEAAAVSLQVAASGAVEIQTTVLLSAEQIDAAVNAPAAYRKPGA